MFFKAGTYANVIVSVIFGFLNFVLWLGSAWFVYKETKFFKSRSAQQQQSQATEGTNVDTTQNGVAKSEADQAAGEGDKRKSSSKKKKHHRRDRYNIPPQPGAPIDINTNHYQQHYPSQPYPPQPNYYGEYQNELPPQLKVNYIYLSNIIISFMLIGSSTTTL